MGKGINIKNTTPRSLALGDDVLISGGETNKAGLYAIGNNLYLDGKTIAASEDDILGLRIIGSDLYFGDVKIGSETPPTPPDPPIPPEPTVGLWVPPTQTYTSSRQVTYRDIINGYDALMSSAYQGTIKKYEYKESNLVETPIKDSRYGNTHTHRSCSHSFEEVAAGAYNDGGDVYDVNYPLYHYEFIPANYTKTFYVQAGIHGNEKDAPQTILRFFDIICNHCEESGYTRLRQLRDNVRFIVVPVVSPAGINDGQYGSMNVPWTDWDGNTTHPTTGNTLMMNMNRNFNFNQAYAISNGQGGNYPNQRSEVRHVVAVVERIGKQNFDYLFDNHDGGNVSKHFWFNYNMDGANAPVMRQLLADLIAYEEGLIANGGTDYRRFLSYVIKTGETALSYTSSDYTHSKKKFTIAVSTQAIADAINADGITFAGSSYVLHEVIQTSGGVDTTIRTNRDTFILPEGTQSVTVTPSVEVGDEVYAIVSPQADSGGWIHPNVADQGGYSTGTTSGWAGITEAILSSGPEYIGGLFGYSFNDEQRTRSLRIRANVILYAYELINSKGLDINEEQGADYFHWDYAPAMTKRGLERDGTGSDNDNRIVTIDKVYDRWDALAAANPSYITKSASLGTNGDGQNIYYYTLGSGSKKVLFIGGAMRWSYLNHKETEFGMYMLARCLCTSYILSQSAFLQRLKQDYTIVVLPCIDVLAGDNNTAAHWRGLNTIASNTYRKWQIVDNKCQPAAGALENAYDVPIFLSFLQAHTDALMILSGGEDTEGPFNGELPKYEQDYMTQLILPMNQTLPQVVQDYLNHLEDDRGEDAADVDHTTGMTFGDYAYDNYGIPTIYLNMKVSQMWDERKQYAQENDDADRYFYRNYETGRRIANIANLFLCY